MIYSDAIQFLYSLRWFGAKFGLDNTLKLAALAGNPHHRLRFIHVAGTNGKGSTCAMLESIYRAAGLRVGLFTSPHLVAFGERIQVNRQLIRQSEVVRLVAKMRELLEKGWGANSEDVGDDVRSLISGGQRSEVRDQRLLTSSPTAEDHPTFFEVVTVLALIYFAEQNCDLVIWETGLGGRLDATNIVTPLASILTNIQYDHQKWLGETLASIAFEKAGIIKPRIPVITAADDPEALRVIEDTALQQNAPLMHLTSQDTHRPPLDSIELPLAGPHQRLNAAVAIAAVRSLASQIPVSDEAIRAGLSCVHWPGRLQLVSRPSGQKILLDGAHNKAGAEILAAALKDEFRFPELTLLLGILRDKDLAGICETLAPLASRILLVPVPSERSATPQELGEICRRINPDARIINCSSLSEALMKTGNDAFVAIAGSLYLIGEAMELLGPSPATTYGERELNEWGETTSNSKLQTPNFRETSNSKNVQKLPMG